MTKIGVYEAFDHKDTRSMNLRTFPQLFDKSCQYRKEDIKNKIMY